MSHLLIRSSLLLERPSPQEQLSQDPDGCRALCSVVCAHHIGADLVLVVGGRGKAGAMTDMELVLGGMLAGMQGAP